MTLSAQSECLSRYRNSTERAPWFRPLLGLTTTGLVLTFFGCASPGIPRPPSLHLPATVTDLSAKRIGDRVELRWTAPDRTTDGLDLTTPTTVEVCRDPASASSSPSGATPESLIRCTPVLAISGHSGPSEAVDHLPANLTSPARQRPLWAYRVRILNVSGRSASPSAAVLIPGGPAPAPVGGFRAVQHKQGVVLEWQKTLTETADASQTGIVEVLRTTQTPPSTKAAQPASRQKGSKANTSSPFSQVHRNDQTTDLRLRQVIDSEPASGAETPQGIARPHDLAGMVDQRVTQQETYTYTAQRVLRVPAGGKATEIRSEPTPPVTLITRDTFPPDAPTGLLSVPGPRTEGASSHRTIDLAWEPNTESDLAGYLVYRRDLEIGQSNNGNGADLRKLTPAPIPGPAYRDADILPGHRYAYRVTAVDRNGNESALSAPVDDSPDGT